MRTVFTWGNCVQLPTPRGRHEVVVKPSVALGQLGLRRGSAHCVLNRLPLQRDVGEAGRFWRGGGTFYFTCSDSLELRFLQHEMKPRHPWGPRTPPLTLAAPFPATLGAGPRPALEPVELAAAGADGPPTATSPSSLLRLGCGGL